MFVAVVTAALAQTLPLAEPNPLPPPAPGDASRFRVRTFTISLGAGAGGVGGEFWVSPTYSAIVEAGTAFARLGVGLAGAPMVNVSGPVDYIMPLFAGVELDAMIGDGPWRIGPSVATWLFIPVGLGGRLVFEGHRVGGRPALGAEFRAYWLHHLLPDVVGPEGEGWLASAAVSVEWEVPPGPRSRAGVARP